MMHSLQFVLLLVLTLLIKTRFLRELQINKLNHLNL